MQRSVLTFVGVVLLTGTVGAADLLKPGEAFPAWTLADQSGALVSSDSLAGRTYLLWFYPMAMTPGCTLEGQGMRDNYDGLTDAGITVLGVSFDEPARNAEFVKQQGFPFRLLSDSGRTLAVQVGAADSTDQRTARRISYLVGRDGRVLKTYGTVSPATHAQQVLDDARAAAR
jgi:peroxiredoxin Q/BCP